MRGISKPRSIEDSVRALAVAARFAGPSGREAVVGLGRILSPPLIAGCTLHDMACKAAEIVALDYPELLGMRLVHRDDAMHGIPPTSVFTTLAHLSAQASELAARVILDDVTLLRMLSHDPAIRMSTTVLSEVAQHRNMARKIVHYSPELIYETAEVYANGRVLQLGQFLVTHGVDVTSYIMRVAASTDMAPDTKWLDVVKSVVAMDSTFLRHLEDYVALMHRSPFVHYGDDRYSGIGLSAMRIVTIGAGVLKDYQDTISPDTRQIIAGCLRD